MKLLSTLRFLPLLLGILSLMSCGSEYKIVGNSSLPFLDGEQVYLRTTKVDKNGKHTTTLDSSYVVHGRFSFRGSVDSIALAELCSKSEHLMPIMVEGGESRVEMDTYGQNVKGGPLNDRLNAFLTKLNFLEGEFWDTDRRRQLMLYQGMSLREVIAKTEDVRNNLHQRIEDLEIKFVIDNAENPLGVGYFQQMVNQFSTPLLTQQLRKILDKAPDSFLRLPQVKSYMQSVGYKSKSTWKK